jgi:fructose-1-phosphate kinase PfkB-like protein
VLVAGPNLTIDRTASLEELRPGTVLRFSRVVVTPGGKGLNVARAARALGLEVLLVGFVPGETGRAGAGMIAREGVALRAVESGGRIRPPGAVGGGCRAAVRGRRGRGDAGSRRGGRA